MGEREGGKSGVTRRVLLRQHLRDAFRGVEALGELRVDEQTDFHERLFPPLTARRLFWMHRATSTITGRRQPRSEVTNERLYRPGRSAIRRTLCHRAAGAALRRSRSAARRGTLRRRCEPARPALYRYRAHPP